MRPATPTLILTMLALTMVVGLPMHASAGTAGDFTIAITGPIIVASGSSNSTRVIVRPVSGAPFVSLTCPDGLPPKATCSFTPDGGVPPFNSTLVINTTPVTEFGVFTLTVRGEGGGSSHDQNVSLTIQQMPVPEFSSTSAVILALALLIALPLIRRRRTMPEPKAERRVG